MRNRGARPRRKVCRNGKRRFPDRISALGALHTAANGSRQLKPIRVYECPDCHGWHLTSAPLR